MTIQHAAELLSSAKRGLALTGAGISAESGIPTFRGEGGLWTKYDPVKVASINYFMADPAAYWKVSKERGSLALAAKPNPAHDALARLESAGHLSAVATQNTDGLHQDSGSKRVIELHGSGRMVQCLDCGHREPRAAVQRRLDVEMPPRCPMCGGTFLKPTVVLFGEAMPRTELEEAERRARACDLFVVVGSSLVVYPAAYMPLHAKDAGATLAIVNLTETPHDGQADLLVRGSAAGVLASVVDRLQPRPVAR